MLIKRKLYIEIDSIIIHVEIDNIGIVSPYYSLEAYLTQCVISNKSISNSNDCEFTYDWIFNNYKKWKLEQ